MKSRTLTIAKILALISLSLGGATPAQANASFESGYSMTGDSSASLKSCSEQLHRILDRRRDAVEGIFSAFAEGGWFAAGLILSFTTPLSGGAVYASVVGMLVVVELPFLVSYKHAKNMYKLLDEARTCEGRSINRAWRKFSRKFAVAGRVEKAQFCNAIVEADLNGSACNGEKVPERHDVLRITAEDLESSGY